MKKSKSKWGVSEEPTIIGTTGLDLISLGLVDTDKIPKYELMVEDRRWLAKEYSRVLMRKHKARQAAESMLLRLKKEAVDALPYHLKEAALIPDLTPFPANRFMATLTPPIERHMETIREVAKRSSGMEKRRLDDQRMAPRRQGGIQQLFTAKHEALCVVNAAEHAQLHFMAEYLRCFDLLLLCV